LRRFVLNYSPLQGRSGVRNRANQQLQGMSMISLRSSLCKSTLTHVTATLAATWSAASLAMPANIHSGNHQDGSRRVRSHAFTTVKAGCSHHTIYLEGLTRSGLTANTAFRIDSSLMKSVLKQEGQKDSQSSCAGTDSAQGAVPRRDPDAPCDEPPDLFTRIVYIESLSRLGLSLESAARIDRVVCVKSARMLGPWASDRA